jgi:hypothetical protein
MTATAVEKLRSLRQASLTGLCRSGDSRTGLRGRLGLSAQRENSF